MGRVIISAWKRDNADAFFERLESALRKADIPGRNFALRRRKDEFEVQSTFDYQEEGLLLGIMASRSFDKKERRRISRAIGKAIKEAL